MTRRMTRRAVLAGGAAVTASAAHAQDAEFRPDLVVGLARDLSRRAYVPPAPLTPALSAVDYETYLRLGFRREQMLWAGQGLSFTADLRPRGYLFPQTVQVNVVENGRSRPVPFSPELFLGPAEVLAALDGFSGLRLQAPLNRADKFDEIAVFQGASYFRSLGRDQGYGLSARGLALGAGDMGEEFPAFTRFWLERPRPGQGSVVVHALLDGPSVAGAYRFLITPGRATIWDVEARLFPRADLHRLGLAPMTSMFFFGPGDRAGVDDFREAAHDSDGLAVLLADGRRAWRPLANPPQQTRITTFDDVRGFGLQQRARSLADFNDLEARYDRRPSLWVEPLVGFESGAVHLVELPARHEGEDNIAAFWRPRQEWRASRSFELRYRLHWGATDPAPRPPLNVAATRIGRDGEPGVRLMVVDWSGDASAMEGAQAVATADAGTILNASAAPHPEAGLLRTTLRYRPAAGEANVNLHLIRGGTAVSETWVYRWTA